MLWSRIALNGEGLNEPVITIPQLGSWHKYQECKHWHLKQSCVCPCTPIDWGWCCQRASIPVLAIEIKWEQVLVDVGCGAWGTGGNRRQKKRRCEQTWCWSCGTSCRLSKLRAWDASHQKLSWQHLWEQLSTAGFSWHLAFGPSQQITSWTWFATMTCFQCKPHVLLA